MEEEYGEYGIMHNLLALSFYRLWFRYFPYDRRLK